jgi:hypothetical protein
LTTENKALDAWLASPEAYTESNKDVLKANLVRQGDVAWQLARLEAEWLELSEALEKFGA